MTNKDEMIRKALLEKKPYKEIAKELRVSFRDITRVSKGDTFPSPSNVFKMFREGISPEEVVIRTNADPVMIADWYRAWVNMGAGLRHVRVKDESEAPDWRKTLSAEQAKIDARS